jgi:hypothetical protein
MGGWMRRVWAAVAIASTLAASAAGCSSDDEPVAPASTGASTPTPTPAIAATPTPAPSASPVADGPVDRSDKKLGIVFTDLPDVTGAKAAPIDAYTLFESDFWRATTTGKIPAEMRAFTSPGAYAIVKAQVDGNKNAGFTVAGTNRIAFLDTDSTKDTATVATCQDAADWQFTDSDGKVQSGSDAGFGKVVVTMTLTKPEGLPWQVETVKNTGKKC